MHWPAASSPSCRSKNGSVAVANEAAVANVDVDAGGAAYSADAAVASAAPVANDAAVANDTDVAAVKAAVANDFAFDNANIYLMVNKKVLLGS